VSAGVGRVGQDRLAVHDARCSATTWRTRSRARAPSSSIDMAIYAATVTPSLRRALWRPIAALARPARCRTTATPTEHAGRDLTGKLEPFRGFHPEVDGQLRRRRGNSSAASSSEKHVPCIDTRSPRQSRAMSALRNACRGA
jgi:hypothetical protein